MATPGANVHSVGNLKLRVATESTAWVWEHATRAGLRAPEQVDSWGGWLVHKQINMGRKDLHMQLVPAVRAKI